MTGANTVDGAAGACGRGERLKRERHEARYRRSGRILFSFLGSSALSASPYLILRGHQADQGRNLVQVQLVGEEADLGRVSRVQAQAAERGLRVERRDLGPGRGGGGLEGGMEREVRMLRARVCVRRLMLHLQVAIRREERPWGGCKVRPHPSKTRCACVCFFSRATLPGPPPPRAPYLSLTGTRSRSTNAGLARARRPRRPSGGAAPARAART